MPFSPPPNNWYWKTLGVAVAMLEKMDTLVPILKNLGKKVRKKTPKEMPGASVTHRVYVYP